MNKRDIETIHPLAPVQQGMLYASLAGADSHLEQVEFTLVGRLEQAPAERALAALVERHAMLRSGFVWKNREQPLQFVLKQVAHPIAFIDLSSQPGSERERAMRDLRQQERDAGFVLSRAPLSRFVLVRLEPRRHALLWTVHHLLVDGWCNGILIGDFLAAYQAFAREQRWNAPAPRPYRDYVAWLARQDAAAAEAYWRAELAPLQQPTLPGRSQPGDSGESGFGVVVIERGSAAVQPLAALLRSRQATWSTLLHACWSVVLAWAAGSRRVVLGTTVGDRPTDLPGIDRTLGPFINTLPLVVDTAGDRHWAALLAEVQRSHLALRRHGHCTTGQVHGWSPFGRAARLFDTLMVFENFPLPSGDQDDDADLPRMVGLGGDGAHTAYAISVLAAAADHGLRVKLVHDAARVDRIAATQLADALGRLLDGAAGWLTSDPSLEQVFNALEVLSPPVCYAGTATTSIELDEHYADALEAAVAAVWKPLLGVERLPADSDFFALGGHSLLAAEVLAALRTTFAAEPTLSVLFEHASVRRMAVWLRQQGVTGAVAEVERAAAQPQLEHDAGQRHAPFSLTSIQQAYWIGRSDAVAMGNIATHAYSEIELADVELDVDRAQAALAALVERHDMLRAVFDAEGQQRVLPEVPGYRIAVHDLRELDPGARRQALQSTRERMSHEVLPSDRWPLFALEGSRIGERHYRVHLSIDMLIVDGGSQHLLMRDFMALYLGCDDALPPLRVTFRDYVQALEALRKGPAFEAARRYWHERIDTLPGAPELPLAIDPSTLKTPRFRRRRQTFSPAQWQRLGALSRGIGISESALLCGLYAEVLRGWSRHDAFCINLTLFDRRPLHPDIGHMVGDFTSTSILECVGNPGSTLGDRLRTLQQRLWHDIDHSLFSGVEVLRELNRRRGAPALMPVVFTSGLVFSGSEADGGSLLSGGGSGEQGDDPYSIGQTSQVWLDLMALNADGGLTLMLDAVDDLFPAGVVDALFAALCRLVSALAESDAALACERLDLLPLEQQDCRVRANATEADLPVTLLHAPALQPGHDGPAVLDAGGGIAFPALRAAVAATMTRLQAAGLGAGAPVAVVMRKGWQQVVATLAITAAGGYYVPVDADQPAARRRDLLEQVGAGIALCQHDAPDDGWPDPVQRIVIEPDWLGGSSVPTLAHCTPDAIAYVIFTSGSTGRPKGVVIDHRGAANTCIDINQRHGIGRDDRVLGLSALNFDLSVYDIFGVLGAGGALVLPDAARLRDPAHWLALIEQHRVSVLNAVPALVQMLVDHLEVNGLELPASVRLVMMSGDWIPLTLPDRLRARAAGRPELVSLGGATEASIWSIAYPIAEVAAQWRSIPYGKPLANQRYHVLHRDLGHCPDHVVGDLYIGGVGLAVGYFDDPDRTAACFIRHPDSGERLYRTGDLGRYFPDGNIEFLGREDGQVKVNGHRIELAEIEAHLLAHPAVRKAVVDVRGRGAGRALLAWVVPAEPSQGTLQRGDTEAAPTAPSERTALTDAGQLPSEAPMADALAVRLDACLREHLPEYMLPKVISLIDRLPLTANGKVDRKALLEPEQSAEQPVGTPLSGELDSQLSTLWLEVLGIAPTRREDNFITLGGNSISLVQMFTRLRARFAVDASLRQLFETPTFAFMRALVERAGTVPEQVAPEQQFLEQLRRLRLEHWVGGMSDAEVKRRLTALSTEDAA